MAVLLLMNSGNLLALPIERFAHTAWSATEGAPSPITALAQSADGYLWLGTPEGLFRFDGIAFERYQPQFARQLPDEQVTSILALPSGDLWIGYRAGEISHLQRDQVMNYDRRDGLPAGRVWGIVQDRKGAIWGATDGGLLRLEGGRWKVIGREWNFPGKSAFAIYEDRLGTLWVSTEDTLVRLPLGATRFQPTGVRIGQVPQIAESASGRLWVTDTLRSVRPAFIDNGRGKSDSTEIQVGSMAILFDRDGGLWITSLGDGLRHSEAPEKLRGKVTEFGAAVESFTEKDGLSDNVVRSILQDREGNVWVGTNEGLDRFRKTTLIPTRLPIKVPAAILIAGFKGDIWLENTGSIFRIRGGQTIHDHTLDRPALTAHRAVDGSIWWITDSSIYQYRAGKYERVNLPSSFPKIYKGPTIRVAQDGSGMLWLSALREGLFYRKNARWEQYDTGDKLAKLAPRSAFTDSQGRVWFGYEGGTILILNQGKIEKVFSPASSPVGNLRVIGGRDQHIWLGGQLGLAYFDGDKFRRVLPDDAEGFGAVMGIQETSDGSLWLASSRGVVEIPAAEARAAIDDPNYRVKYHVFDSDDGLLGKFTTAGTSSMETQGSDGRLWFAASGYVVSADPSHIFTNMLPPPVSIRSVTANGKEMTWLRSLVLPPLTTNVDIDYTALSLSAPEKVRFRYRLEGADRDWHNAGTRRQALYTRLGPGRYRFLVVACNDDGVWNETGVRLDFEIAPAYYQTAWFRSFYVLALLLFLAVAYQVRIRHLRAQEKQFRDALETMPALAFVVDPKGNRTFFNRGWIEYTGFSAEQGAGYGWEKAIHPDDLERVNEQWYISQQTGQPLDYEARLRRGTDGIYRWFQTRALPLQGSHGETLKWCAVSNDIEDRKHAEQLQADLTHASRISMMGEMVASISHELAQPITVSTAHAKASLRWLLHEPPDIEQVQKGTEKIIEAGTLASQIIDRLRSLYKKAPAKRELVAVNEVILEMTTMMGGEARAQGVLIHTELADDLPMTMADRVQLQQVLMNLILNGLEASKQVGGVVKIKSEFKERDQIEISVSDAGPGLPTDRAEQIFDAFFTTKPEGSGMGLAISKSIVEFHGGRMWAVNGIEGGATFHFILPVCNAAKE